jgi:hypothetical protein
MKPHLSSWTTMTTRTLLTTTAAYEFPSNMISIRQKQQQHLWSGIDRRGTTSNVVRPFFTNTAVQCQPQRHRQQLLPQRHSSYIATGTSFTTTTTTSLHFYHPRHQLRHDREMSKITERKNQERMKKKHQEQRDGTDSSKKKKEPYEWLPFWTTPERDPHESIYIQDPIAEKDCTPLRLYIPTEVDMAEIGTMCAMLFLTTPNLETYESMPNNGDVIFLKGDLGSGKSVFARGFVRGALGDWKVDVPSPTYLLSNTYFASEDKGSNKNLECVYLIYFDCVGIFFI